MVERPHHLGNWCMLFTDATCLACLYCWFGTLRAERLVAVSLPAWLAWMTLCYLAFALLLRRPRSPAQLLWVGGALYLAGAAAVLGCSQLSGVSSALFALLFLLATPLRSALLLLEPWDERRPRNYVELAVASTAAFMAMQLAGVALPPFYNACCLVSVALCFGHLIASRLLGPQAVLFSKGQGLAVLAGCAGGLAALLALFARFASGPAQQGILAAWAGLKEGAAALGRGVGAFFDWLISLLPAPEPQPMELPGGPALPGGDLAPQEAGAQLPAWLLPALILAAAVALVVVFSLAMRRARLGGQAGAPAAHARPKQAKGPRLWALLRAGLLRLAAHLRFCWLRWRWRASPQGTLLWLERWARAARAPRAPGETHRAFLLRLAGLAAFEGAGPLLEQLAAQLDECYFGPGRGGTLHPQRALRPLRRPRRQKRGGT